MVGSKSENSKKRLYHQINIRLDQETFTLLNDIAKEENHGSPATHASQIIRQYVEFYYYKIHRGDITFSQPIIRKFVESIGENEFEEISKYAANFIINEIKSQEGPVSYEILVEHILKWNKGNHLVMNRFEQDGGSDIFVSRHNLGANWSEIECKTYSKIFEMIGKTVINQEYDKEDMFSFEVIVKR